MNRRDGLFRRSGWWWIDFRDADGRRHRQKAAPSYEVAKPIYRDKMNAIAKGEVLGVREEGMRYKDFVEKTWLPRVAPRLAPAWCERVAGILWHTLIPTFGSTTLSIIRKNQVESWASRRLADVGPSALNKEIWVLKNSLKSAASWGYIKTSPAAELRRVKESHGRVRYLEPTEREALLEDANPTLKLYIVAALQTGARRAELLRLTWSDVDFTTGLVTFRDTKNGDSRSVPMTATLRTLLEGLDRSSRTVLPSYAPLVLTRSFTRLTHRLGIKNLTFHDLRHDAASTLAMAGVPLRTIAAILGHRDIRMTSRYAHLAPEHLRDAMQALDTGGRLLE